MSDDWLADRAALHDAKVLSVLLDGNALSIRIDDEWPNISISDEDSDNLGGWLTFERAEILEGDMDDAEGRFVSELKLVGSQWLLFLARPSFFSRRSRFVIRAENASFIPCS